MSLTEPLRKPTKSHTQIKQPSTTPTMPLKALFFDVFGTCVDWRKTVTEGLIAAAKEAGDTTMASSQLEENPLHKPQTKTNNPTRLPQTGPPSPKNGEPPT